MFKRNSIFIKILIPVIVVMLLQAMLISAMLLINGTIGSLSDSAVGYMQKNAENRRITLENMMVLNWSNLDRLESDIKNGINAYLNENGIDIGGALDGGESEIKLLSSLSGPLIDALRRTGSTGVFMYFPGDKYRAEQPFAANGLYYRDLDPIHTPADNSDIMFLRGHVSISRKDRLQLDSLWSETFVFSPGDADGWASMVNPLLAAGRFPSPSPADCGYWTKPHLLNPDSRLDANPCVTYSRPLYYGSQLIAVIGADIQVSYLEKYLPANDSDNAGRSGYMLLSYNAAEAQGPPLSCDVYAVTGSYVKRIIGQNAEINIAATGRPDIYALNPGGGEGAQIALNPLRLYNSNAPFSAEQWALAAICADSMLFESTDNVINGLIFSTLFALILGGVTIAMLISHSTRPLIAIVNQITKSGPDDPVILANSDTYEIDLLCSTINDMKTMRIQAETELRAERERYLLALESAADTFMEYDAAEDSFRLYYFSGEDQQLNSNTIPRFAEEVRGGEICHPDDADELLMFLTSRHAEPIVIRVKAALLSHITSSEPDGDYYWMSFKASRVSEPEGGQKIVGTAKEITAEKLAEFAYIETTRRDPTTGFYNRDFGMHSVWSSAYDAVLNEKPYAVCWLRIDNFEQFEAYYGRFFSAVVLMQFCRELRAAASENDVFARLTNDECLFLLCNAGEQAVRAYAMRVYDSAARLYTGENTELKLNISMGAALSSDADNHEALVRYACQAFQYAAQNGGGRLALYGELPDEARMRDADLRDTPVNAVIDIPKQGVVGFVFELFERTLDIRSAVHILLPLLGEAFALCRLIVCSYDADFNAGQVTFQWHDENMEPYSQNIEKCDYADITTFNDMLDENGTVLYTTQTLKFVSDGVKRILFDEPDEISYCCVMYENEIQAGRVIFKKTYDARAWTETEQLNLYEITKIIAAHISIEKSNSASKAKSEFLSRVSHEIRTPMNAIIGMTNIAKASINDPARLTDSLSKIDYSAKHLLDLINDVLDMSRIESGKMQLVESAFSLPGFVESVDTLMRPPITAKGINFIIDNSAAVETIVGDEHRLRQVLINLLGNANKFTEPGGEIVCSIAKQPEQDGDDYVKLRFSVKDNGAGISLEDQPIIFKAFEQAEGSKTEKKRQGTGLGLAISDSIISAMGGKIELISQPGKGSEFFFTLRFALADAQGGRAGEERDIDYGERFSGKHVLLAEDNDINVEIMRYILEDTGILLDVAGNGQEALDKFNASGEGFFDIILMDIQMPLMDGLTAARSIRKNTARQDARNIPIIAMTANAFDEDMRKSIESGMNGHIAKPIDTKKLYELLDVLIK